MPGSMNFGKPSPHENLRLLDVMLVHARPSMFAHNFKMLPSICRSNNCAAQTIHVSTGTEGYRSGSGSPRILGNVRVASRKGSAGGVRPQLQPAVPESVSGLHCCNEVGVKE